YSKMRVMPSAHVSPPHPRSGVGRSNPPCLGRVEARKRALSPLHSWLDETVPNPTYRIEILGCDAELLSKPAHVRVHRPRVDQRIVFPHVLQELFAGLHASPTLSQGCDELELGGGQVDPFAFD